MNVAKVIKKYDKKIYLKHFRDKDLSIILNKFYNENGVIIAKFFEF